MTCNGTAFMSKRLRASARTCAKDVRVLLNYINVLVLQIGLKHCMIQDGMIQEGLEQAVMAEQKKLYTMKFM